MKTSNDSPAGAPLPISIPDRPRKLRLPVLGIGLASVLLCWCFREPLRARIFEKGVIANDYPPVELVDQMIKRSSNPASAALAAWNSGKIVHRQVSIKVLSEIMPPSEPLPSAMKSVVLAGALDPDLNVRELALNILRCRKDPDLPALAAAQLQDVDPEVRQLAFSCLRPVNAAIGIPTVIPSLNDASPLLVTMAVKALENWTGENFGVSLLETQAAENSVTGLLEFSAESRAKAKAGADRARLWWVLHQSDYPPVPMTVPAAAGASRLVPAGDFQLTALDGKKFRLSDLRGSVVLVNFWTTWCPSCLSEIPELVALQNRHRDRLAIVGVSLDFIPNDHGEIGGEELQESPGHVQPSWKKIREKVIRTVKDTGINYTVLIDEKNMVGGRYNGGELPTTLIIDPQGWVRRRFIGSRSLEVFEAMVAEASQPVSQNTQSAGK